VNEFLDLQRSRIAITGGMGFVGGAIAKRLLMEGATEVVLLGRHQRVPTALQEWLSTGRLRTAICDIRKPDEVRRALAGCDAVFHQAALRVTACAREPDLALEIMVAGAANVFSACADLGVKKVVAASSAIAYGEATSLPISEDHPLRDTSVYAVAKVHNEQLLASLWDRHRLNYTVLRYFNVYGPGMTLAGDDVEVLIRWLDRFDSDLPPLIFGDGKQTLDWVFVDDVADANRRALSFSESGKVFNVCSGRETTLLELLEILCRVTGWKTTPEFHPSRAVNHVARRCGDPRRAAEQLQFRVATTLEDGMARLVQWRAGVKAGRSDVHMHSLFYAPQCTENTNRHSV
jgi:UDP-glucose 4-epimerase